MYLHMSPISNQRLVVFSHTRIEFKPLSIVFKCVCLCVVYASIQTGNYSEALQWYNYSLSFFKAGQIEPNLAKLQRNRASCLLQLEQLEKAKEAIKEAERCDPECIFTQFSIYKIAVQENNVEKAAEALNA
ncbi:hypothetical protein CHARACLAT_031572, partial [Characodon lateralis]|nr:hypothetical protein [Characodon lateralis]